MSVETDHYLTFLVYLGAIPMTFQRYYIEYSTVSILRLAIPLFSEFQKWLASKKNVPLSANQITAHLAHVSESVMGGSSGAVS